MPFADMSRTSGKTEMALTQRSLSNSAKTSVSVRKKSTDWLNLAAVVYQYTPPASKIVV